MTEFSTLWMDLREELLSPEGGTAAADRRRWLRACRDDPSCRVRDAADYVSRHPRPTPPTPTAEWLAMREDLLPAEGAPGPDHPGWGVVDRLASGLSPAARDLLERMS